MEKLEYKVTSHGWGVLTLNGPPENTLTTSLMEDLLTLHKKIDQEETTKALIVTSSVKKFFSNGLDPLELYNSDRAGKIEIFHTLYRLIIGIYSFSKPHISLINGTAMAGGAVMASLSDFRFITDGPWRYCFSEVKIGLGVPADLQMILRQYIDPGEIRNALLLSRAYKPHEALEHHLVDRIYPENEALERTFRFLGQLFRLPITSLRETKLEMRKSLIEHLKKSETTVIQSFENLLTESFEQNLKIMVNKHRIPE